MSQPRRRAPLAGLAGVAALALAALGCSGIIVAEDGGGPNSNGPNGGPNGPNGGGTEKPPDMAEDCTGWEIAMPKRLIRLTFHQIASSLRPVFGDAFAEEMISANSIVPPTRRTFPPLGDISEGSSYIDTRWQTADAIAKAAGEYALANFAEFTQCGASPTDECARNFVLDLAERAFRRPLSETEKTSLLKVYDDSMAAPGAQIPEAVQHSVYAIYSSPHFLYRTELGTGSEEGPLTPYEVASQISYFLTDGPPDQALLDAARAGALATPEQIGPHVDRLLATSDAQINLASGVLASLGISNVRTVVIDPSKVPTTDFNAGVAASMYREAELFINNVLWKGGKVSDLITSRNSFIDANLAKIYGVPAPTANLDADGFGPVELPENRAGLLTLAGFLTSRSRPDEQSVVGRGLAVNDAILCQQNPAFPENLASQIEALSEQQASLTEREKAEYRAKTTPCNACHASFDPYGVALENYDIIGRFRTTDSHDRPIDASVTLPDRAGGGVAQNAVEVANALASSGAFAACVATKLMTYALAETGVTGNSCATKAVAAAFAQTDQSFAALVKAVAVSKTLTHRSGG